MLNEDEASNWSDTELKTMVTRMFQELGGIRDEISEILNRGIVSMKKDIETIKRTSEPRLLWLG